MANHHLVPHEAHKYDFDVSGPRNLTALDWRDIFSSSWKDENYKQTAISCFTRAAYLLEVDRQENRTHENSLARKWLTPFKYKVTQTLIDERDGSIFGAIFEWDQPAALADLVLIRPSGAPKAVLAIRGTILKRPTMRRDLVDDARFFILNSLKGSARFEVAMEALKSVCDIYGSRNVCIAGHSLGAGFALQLGKELSDEGINVETHLFNPPSVSLASNLGNIGELIEYVWNGLKFMLVSGSEAQVSYNADEILRVQLKSLMPCLSGLMDSVFGVDKWIPHVYVNNNDYICRLYNIPDGSTEEMITDKENLAPTNEEIEAKLFVVYNEDQKFLEAHGLDQWWSSDAHSSKLTRKQLRSLNTPSLFQATCLLCPTLIPIPISLQDIGAMTNLFRIRLSSLLPSSGEAQVVWLKNWIPPLSGLKDAVFWVCNRVPYLYVWTSYTDERKVPTDEQIVVQLLAISRRKQTFLVAHGLKQWWQPSEAELLQAIHENKLMSSELRSLYTITHGEVAQLFNPSSISLTMSFSNIREKAEFVSKWNGIKAMISSSGEAQLSSDGDKTSGVHWKSWMPRASGLKDACLVFGKWVPYLYFKIVDYISRHFGSLCSCKPSQVMHLFDVPSLSVATGIRNTREMTEFFWNRLKSMLPSSSKVQVSNNDSDMTSGVFLKSSILLLFGLKDAAFGVAEWVLHVYVNRTYGIDEKLVCKENMGPTNVQTAEDFFIISKEKLKLLKFSSDAELLQAIHYRMLISQQLRSLYNSTPWEVAHLFNPSSISVAMILSNIVERPELVWKWNSIKSMFSSGGKSQLNDGADMTSGMSLKSSIPQSSEFKDSGFEVPKRVPHLYVNKTDSTVQKMDDKENMLMDLSNGKIEAKFSAISNYKPKLLEAHVMKQWWSSGAEIQQVIHISKIINNQIRSSYTSTSLQVTHLFNQPSISLAKSLMKAHGLEQQCWSSDAVLQHVIQNTRLINTHLRYVCTGTSSQAAKEKP